MVMVFDETFHKTYERGLLGNVPQVRYNSIYFRHLFHYQE